jgi:hypothetical protein
MLANADANSWYTYADSYPHADTHANNTYTDAGDTDTNTYGDGDSDTYA